jgi:hypothetical protein
VTASGPPSTVSDAAYFFMGMKFVVQASIDAWVEQIGTVAPAVQTRSEE